MLTKHAHRLLVAGVVLAASFAAWPQSSPTNTVPADRLAQKFTDLAGSETNAKSLVTGLRDGSDIKLSSATGTTTIDPQTGKMGYGNVNIALSLADASLKQAGIANPTPDQLAAALNGGSVTNSDGKTVAMSGVLRMRAEGKGWGQIAQSMGFKLGEVVRSEKAARNIDEHRPAKGERVAHGERDERPVKAERAERPERAERAERAERPERPERASR
jgi:hypothetical protein